MGDMDLTPVLTQQCCHKQYLQKQQVDKAVIKSQDLKLCYLKKLR